MSLPVAPLNITAGDANDPVFVGVGEIVSGRFPDRSFIQSLTQVAIRALKDASMVPADIDTVVLIPALHSFDQQADLVFSRMVEELGLNRRAKANFMVHSGGSTSDNVVRVVSGLISSGHAKTVLVLQAEGWGSADLREMVTMLSWNGIPAQWERESGLNFNSIGGLITQRYMLESGSSAEDLAGVCVSLRKWANLNPNAMYANKTLSVEQVLASKMVSDPLHAMECPMMADGGVGFVMTSAANAKAKDLPAVRVAGSGGVVSHYSIGQETDLATLGWKIAAERTFEQSGWGPEDIDMAQVYDSYAAVMSIAVEGLGLAKSGEGARLIASGATSPGGSGIPMNTNGGLLSAGHTGVGGGTALLAEGVRQVLGRADAPRQVADVNRVLIAGTGGSYMDSQVLLLERAGRN
ncbi:thiolase family protein [Agrococcus baldri]|uniref:Thiolase n=1 Tax=Agrococcus baldri TaxID=153730 RepID=A0AA87RE31_9MICO|nr:thiolase family protein [Agrococcus baldri]GEK79104.1 thiolase [Agrococcus baldri]